MTQLGIHVASTKRTGSGDLLAAGAALVVLVDQNMIEEAHQAGATVAFRTKQSRWGEDNPNGIDQQPLSNIANVARTWMDSVIPIWQKNAGADYYLPNNEWDIGTLDSGLAINDFALNCMRMADIAGYKLGILNFSTGCPSDDPVNGAPCSMEQRLATVLPALRYAARNGHAVSLHVHAMDHGDLQNTGESIALRFERFQRFCQAHGFLSKILVTELSNGTGGVQPNTTRYLAAVRWFDRAVQSSPFKDQFIGAALYGFNAKETLKPVVPQLAAIMRETPAPIDPDPIVKFQGTCRASNFDRVAVQVMAAGGTIGRVE